MLEKVIEDTIVKLLKLAVTQLPSDVKEALRKARELEKSEIARSQLDIILANIKLAEEASIPLCQDTGIITFYIFAGSEFPLLNDIPYLLEKAVRRATKEIPLRPNTVDPFTGKNEGDNTGKSLPHIYWKPVPGNTIRITALPKGGGSENMATVEMLNPSHGMKGVKRFILDTVIRAGGKPCPPTVLGVGIGGGADIALHLAKKALLRPIGRHNEDPNAANLERKLLNSVNQTGIGPMGLGGDITVLWVSVEYAHRHPASLPVAMAFQCWAARKASAEIWPDGRVEYQTHLNDRLEMNADG